MSEVNYLGYAQLIGQRNPTAEGLATLGQSLDQMQATDRQRKMDAMTMEQNRRASSLTDLQMQQTGLNLAQDRAGSLAMIGQYGTGDRPDFQAQLADATAFKAQEEKMAAAAKMEAEETQRYFQTVKMMKDAGATPDTITAFSKVALKSNPKYASIADTVSYMDDTKMVVTRDVKDGELPDPTRPGQFMPAGKYELEAVATGNPTNPYKFNKIVPAKPDAESMLDKRFAQQQQLQAQTIAAQDARLEKTLAAARQRDEMKDQKGKVGKPLPAAQLESISDMKKVRDTLMEAKDMAGTVTTGPVAGRLQSIGAKVGAADNNFVNFQQKLSTAQNIMLKLRSGAAVTDQEYERFLKEYPTPNDPPATRDIKINNAINYATNLMNEKLDIYEEGGYKVPRQSATKTPGKPSAPNKTSKGGKPSLDSFFK